MDLTIEIVSHAADSILEVLGAKVSKQADSGEGTKTFSPQRTQSLMGSESVSDPLRLVVKFPAAYWTTFPIFIECHAEELRLKSSSAPSRGNGCVGRKDRQAGSPNQKPQFPCLF